MSFDNICVTKRENMKYYDVEILADYWQEYFDALEEHYEEMLYGDE